MTDPILTVLPIILPLMLGTLALACRKHSTWLQWIGMGGSLLMVAANAVLFTQVWQHGTLVTYIGQWVPPFGICMVADPLSSTLTLTTSVIVVLIMAYSLSNISSGEQARGFYTFAFILNAGINGAFLTGDIFNLYVWFEVMLISTFALLTLGRTREQMQAAIKYAAINLVATMLILTSIGLLYGTVGTLNMADLHLAIQDVYAYDNPATLKIISVMMVLALGIKAGAFPLYFWLPASYHTASPPTGALFASLLTKVGIYCMFRIFTIVLPIDQLELLPLFTAIAAATMVIPILGALVEKNAKRLLGFCLLSHIGTMLVGLACFNTSAFAGLTFYLVHHMCIMAYLFLIIGTICTFFRSDDLRLMGGLMSLSPKLAWLLFLPTIALAGMPPFSGFWPKLLLIKATLEEHEFILTLCIITSSILTLYAMLRMWHQIAWRPYPCSQKYHQTCTALSKTTWASLICFALIILLLGIYPEPLLHQAGKTAAMLLDPYRYVDAVLGGIS